MKPRRLDSGIVSPATHLGLTGSTPPSAPIFLPAPCLARLHQGSPSSLVPGAPACLGLGSPPCPSSLPLWCSSCGFLLALTGIGNVCWCLLVGVGSGALGQGMYHLPHLLTPKIALQKFVGCDQDF